MNDRRRPYGADLKLLRDKHNLTQAEAARMAGVSTRAWQAWENGHAYPAARHRREIERLWPELAVA